MGGLPNIYRFWHAEKISSLRLLAYVFFGYAASGQRAFVEYGVNTLVIVGGILFASLLNDYYDFMYFGERNAIGKMISDGRMHRVVVQLCIWVPWVMALVLFVYEWRFLHVTALSLVLLWIAFLLSFAYSSPPLRLKERKILGVVTPPLGIFMLFLQGFTLAHLPDARSIMIAAMVFVFAWHLEWMHLVDDSIDEHDFPKVTTQTAMRMLALNAYVGLASAFVGSFWYPILYISVIAWALRIAAIQHISPDDVVRARRNIFHPLWRLEEFCLYAFFGLLQYAGYMLIL